MTRVPFAAWALGLAGLVPFAYGAAMLLAADGALPGFGVVPASREGGALILERFGAAILGFMGGCLWGFASARPEGPSLPLLAAAAVPAFLAFVAVRDNPALSCVWLAFGFAALQAIDVGFHRAGVAPGYWLTLRLPLTAVVIACLLVGALYG
jgi:hypothetical protein